MDETVYKTIDLKNKAQPSNRYTGYIKSVSLEQTEAVYLISAHFPILPYDLVWRWEVPTALRRDAMETTVTVVLKDFSENIPKQNSRSMPICTEGMFELLV